MRRRRRGRRSTTMPRPRSVASQPTTKSAGRWRPSMVNVDGPGRASGTVGAPSGPARPDRRSRAGATGRAVRGGAMISEPGSASPGPRRSTLGERVLRRRGRCACAADRGPTTPPDAWASDGGWAGAPALSRARRLEAGRQRLDGRRAAPHAARSPCRTRRTATSPGRRGGSSSGRPG